LPVIGVPVQTHALNGMDSLLSIVQMPAGVPVATTAIGVAGAKNAALLAIEILGIENASLIAKLVEFRQSQHDAALESGEKLD
jgi:5-(carboxyamino)imidazole ribonucleotide mutase